MTQEECKKVYDVLLKRASLKDSNCLRFKHNSGSLAAEFTYKALGTKYYMYVCMINKNNYMPISLHENPTMKDIVDCVVKTSRKSDVFIYQPQVKIMSKNESLESLFIAHDMDTGICQ